MKKQQYRDKVLEVAEKEPFRAFKAKEIARRLKIHQDSYHLLRAELRAMVQEGILFKYPRNRYGKGRAAQEKIGVLHVKTQGYGFVLSDDGDDVFVSQRNMGVAMHKDKVRVRLFAQTSGVSREGRIEEVLERARRNIVGVFRRGRKYGFVVPDELKISRDIYIHASQTKNAKEGQKVVAQITSWQDARMNPEGRIIEVLGYPDEKGVDVISVARRYELPHAFPAKVMQEVRGISAAINEHELADRLDLRETETITIDPFDAKDFDDAVSLESLEGGALRLGVHIADVSHYVARNGAVDLEAKRRGTSIYMVDRVIPMLPEKLSNEICSLVEGQDRLTYSVILDLSPSGEMLQYSFAQSIIRSARRYTYEQVQEILEGKNGAAHGPMLRKMRSLSQSLIRKRWQRGSIDLDAPEVEVLLDERGHPRELRKRDRLDSHRLIEEFMLLANETVARHVAEMLERPPFVYRIHEKPDSEKLADFFAYIAAFGITAPQAKRITPRFFQKLLQSVEGLDAEPVIRDAMLRAMMKARYDTEPSGHFGLAYKHYTHFTSPIRRYADLTVHRLLKQYSADGAAVAGAAAALGEICREISAREVVAQEAERESIKMKKIEYLSERIGKTYSGIITRVVPFGVFVELFDFLIEGLVHVTDLGQDYFIHDERKYAMIGKHRGAVFRVGDTVNVRVQRVDVNQRLVDFVLG